MARHTCEVLALDPLSAKCHVGKSGGQPVLGRAALFACASACVLFPEPASADGLPSSVNIDAGALASGLQDLERQTGAELLYDPLLVDGRRAQAVRGRFTTEDALRRLLAGSNLRMRRATSGAWIVEQPSAQPLAQQDAPVAEIIVVGRRTQNGDIRRFENDVQPYTISTKSEILAAHRDNLEQFFQSRVTSNTQFNDLILGPSASTGSAVDLRGLGSRNTLVLVDGRRMPELSLSSQFVQPDVNPIPLHAIQRIETLTGAAGGIYGFGALGGVVNVVLDRNSRGLDVFATTGESSRGDSFQRSLELSYGATSPDGRTDFTLFAAYSRIDTPLVGERSFGVRDRTANGPTLTPGNSLGIISLLDSTLSVVQPNLTFKPEFGGATLPSYFTFLPASIGGSGDVVAALTQNAGRYDYSIDDGAARSDLGANPEMSSLFLNVRHRFGQGIEAYADAVLLRSRGESHSRSATALGIVTPDSPANPFDDYLLLSFPVDGADEATVKHTESTRYTGGLLFDLPFDWRGAAELSFGSFRYEPFGSSVIPSFGAIILTGDSADPNPFGDWSVFQSSLPDDVVLASGGFTTHTRLRDQSLRLAGPLFNTGAGATTLTLLGEHRSEHSPAYTEFFTDTLEGETTTTQTTFGPRTDTTTSFYSELRSPIFGEDAPAWFLRRLELQLAVRRDSEEIEFNRTLLNDGSRARVRFDATAYTAGARVSPTPWLMLRGSYATGEQPPLFSNLIESDPTIETTALANDPKRGNTGIGQDVPYVLREGGSSSLGTIHADTMSLGAIFMPLGEDGPSLALDYSRIRETRDVLFLSPQVVLDHESYWPDRVERAPLSDADRALGYTAGPVTMIDARNTNGAGLEVDALDMHGQWPISFAGGRLRFYVDATYHMRNVVTGLFRPDVERAGYREGPLKWRANGGVEWSNDALTFGANLQYFDSYYIFDYTANQAVRDLETQIQGAVSVPSQSYLDLYAAWRPRVRNDVTISLGIINVLDTAPPRESSVITFGQGYSSYGDPRQRRFELVLSSHF